MTHTTWLRTLKRKWEARSHARAMQSATPAHQATLERLLASGSTGRSVHELFRECTDDFWFWCATEGYRHDARLRAILPTLPSEEEQFHFTGAAGDDTLREAFAFYTLVRSLCRQHMVHAPETVLDFGCGWGRIVRFFAKDVDRERLWGIDCTPEAIDLCKATNRDARFSLVAPLPPSQLPENAFDLVYSYSVFSHLSEDAHLAWLAEFRRILKPGGLLIATTRPREFILTCAKARAANETRDWALGTASAFPNTEDALARFDRGEFLYHGVGGGGVLDQSFFGETCIPQQYVRAQWTKWFAFVGFVDDRRVCIQNVIVVRKTA